MMGKKNKQTKKSPSLGTFIILPHKGYIQLHMQNPPAEKKNRTTIRCNVLSICKPYLMWHSEDPIVLEVCKIPKPKL